MLKVCVVKLPVYFIPGLPFSPGMPSFPGNPGKPKYFVYY